MQVVTDMNGINFGAVNTLKFLHLSEYSPYSRLSTTFNLGVKEKEKQNVEGYQRIGDADGGDTCH